MKYTIEDTIFQKRAMSEMSKLKSEHDEGKYQTKTEYAYAISKKIKDLYQSAATPSFLYKESSDIPSFLNYKDMFTSASSDISTLLGSYNETIKLIDKIKEQSSLSNKALDSAIDTLDLTVSSYEDNLISLANGFSTRYTDNFSNKDYSAMGTIPPSALDLGSCRLCSTLKNPVNDFSVGYGDYNNGFPGNTHEANLSIDGYVYTGVSNPSINPSNVLIKSTNEWFEFEMFTLDSDLFHDSLGVGFQYKEGVPWIVEHDALKLSLRLTYKEPTQINTILIEALRNSPYLRTYPILESVVVIDSSNTKHTVKVGAFMKDASGVSFPPVFASEIIINFVQNESYETTVAKVTYTPGSIKDLQKTYTNEFKTSAFVQSKYTYLTIERDLDLFSITNLGLMYDISSKSVKYPPIANEFSFITDTTRDNNIYHYGSSFTDGELRTELIKANRFLIAIKSIYTEYGEYGMESVYNMKEYESVRPIKRITLNATEIIPQSFSSIENEYDFEEGYGYIEYYIRLNDETDYIRVHPREKFYNGPSTIDINSSTGDDGRNPNIIYVDRPNDIHKVNLRIINRGHSEIKNETPIVSEYFLEIDTV